MRATLPIPKNNMIEIWLIVLLALLVSPSVFAFKVGLVLDKGGKDDRSFNSAAFEGATKAKKELGIELKYVEAMDQNAFENLHRSFATKGYDLIIGVGFAQTDAIKKIAKQFPDKKFAIVDGEINQPNVRSLLFQEHEGSYLVGAIAALKSTSHKVGFIGGMDIPLIRRFELGYKTGAEKTVPQTKVVSHFIGVTGDAWNNPAKAKELALSQYNSGVDIIFVAAGASGAGVFDAAEEKKKLAIGVDSNQNWLKPGFILTSMMKRVDLAVYDTIKLTQNNQFKGEVTRFGLKDAGVDFAIDEHNKNVLPADIISKAQKIKADIISGKIVVPDYYQKKH